MGEVVMDVTGVAMFLDDYKMVVFGNALKGRLAEDKKTVIPPHVTVLAVPAGSYQFTGPNTRAANFTFPVKPEMLGAGAEMKYDAFLLSNDTLRVNRSSDLTLEPDWENEIVRMRRDIIPGKALHAGVTEGTHSSVIARFHTEGASLETQFPSTLKFGANEHPSANTLRFRFRVPDDSPTVTITGPDVPSTIKLTGQGPWTLILADLPYEEYFRTMPEDHVHDEPMHHFVLLYDFFQLADGDPKPVPTHVMQHSHGTPLLGPPGRCAPPVG